MGEQIPDKNLFMMCREVNRRAFRELPAQFHIRTCRKEELPIWKGMHFDDEDTRSANAAYMTEFFNRVYGPKEEEFYHRCFFVCEVTNRPIGTIFIWKAYDSVNTLHWFKVEKGYEGKGIGKGLMTYLLKDLESEEFPIYLHTQPGSYRAIKLYTDFGFQLIENPVVGNRVNDIAECLPILKQYMSAEAFASLTFTTAPAQFLEAAASEKEAQF